MNRKTEDRIVTLTSRLCDAGLDSPDELAELEALLESSEEARSLYSQIVEIHGRLHRDTASSTRVRSDDPVDRLKRPAGEAHTSRPLPRTFLALATAATLVGVIVWQSTATKTDPGSITQTPTSIARVVQKIDCNWESERWGTADSHELAIGQVLNLDSGVMVVEFGCGAMLTLEGPAQLKVESERRAFLFNGKLSAEVPKSGRGFTVGTPAGEAIDLGTNFGLAVGGDGAVETHVFEGEVVLRKKSADNSSQPVEFSLTTDMAKRIFADSEEVEEFQAKPRQFTQLASYDVGEQISHLEQIQIPQGEKIALWLDAGARLQLDEQDQVIAWSDRTQRSHSDSRAAWQVRRASRPKWKPAALNGRPAVRFDGKAGLMTTPFTTGNDVTVAIVASSQPTIKGADVGMMINFNGPPNMVLERHATGVLQGRMYAGFIDGEYTHGAFLSGGELQNESPFVGLLVYSYLNDKSSLWFDGKLVAQGGASEPAEIRSPRFIGRHREGWKDFFVGDIGELIVFDTALSDRECKGLTDALMMKYSLNATEQ